MTDRDNGDSPELEALFDSMLTGDAPAATPEAAAAPAAGNDADDLEALFDQTRAQAASGATPTGSGAAAADSDDLEALFDQARAAGANDAADTVGHTAEVAADAPMAGEMYARIGHLTRKLHDTMRELGFDKSLQRAAESIPTTRERLLYVADMTEKAALRTLNAIDAARPEQALLGRGATELASRWDALFNNQLSVDEFRDLAQATRLWLHAVPTHTQATDGQLTEIMMAQDFQDLTGQVVKKIIDVAQDLENQMLQMLVETTPAGRREQVDAELLNGPATGQDGLDQQQVDDLLDSLGF